MKYFNKNIPKPINNLTVVFLIFLIINTMDGKPTTKSSAMTAESAAAAADLDAQLDSSLYNGDLSPHIIRQIQKCDDDLESMELCMRCAKVTKSETVYPMCCDNEDGVKEWCHEYIFFGANPTPY